MPKDESILEQLPPPSRQQIEANVRVQIGGQFVEQIVGLEADKAMLQNELTLARRRIAELEARLAPVEPAHADD